jgi:hypothetical protein
MFFSKLFKKKVKDKRYRVTAVIREQVLKSESFDDFKEAENWLLKYAGAFRFIYEFFVISIHDMNIKNGANLVAQFVKDGKVEQYRRLAELN